jgi:hypothetical protein
MTRILHLDDEADRRNLMREALQDHCVYSLGRLEDALTALGDGSHFDLALVAMTSKSDPGTCRLIEVDRGPRVGLRSEVASSRPRRTSEQG